MNDLINIDTLNQAFSINDEQCQINFKKGRGDIPLLEIKNQQASALISLQGAHFLSWIPKGEDEVIWLSSDARFEKGKSVRGGIPICWPWFGAHESNDDFPAHGFARTVIWNVCEVKSLTTGETQIKFDLDMLQADADRLDMWPANTRVEYLLTIGKSLSLELITHNNGTENCLISEALHTYFNVGEIEKVTVQGLHGVEYLDKPDGFKRKKQTDNITILGEVDRVYINAPSALVISHQDRNITINTQGSQSTIVWNPGKVVAEKMGDLGEDGYLKMLCVESGNAAENQLSIAPGESHTLQVKYAITAVS